MKRCFALLLFLSLSFWLWSQSFSFRDPAFVAGLAPSGPGVWYPTNDSSCTIWFDAGQQVFSDNAGTIAAVDGDLVGCFTSIGKIGLSVTSTLAKTMADFAPRYDATGVNGKPALLFRPDAENVTNFFLQSTTTNVDSIWGYNSFVCFLVADIRTNSAAQISFPFRHSQNNGTNTVAAQLRNDSTAGFTFQYVSTSGDGLLQSLSDPPGDPCIFEFWHSNGLAAYIITNGILADSRTCATNMNRWSLPARFTLSHTSSNSVMVGHIAEVVIFTNVLSWTDIASERNRLAVKYGITVF